ncbi:MAG: YdcF family protein [Gudongella sp.]|jgi:uncharacterized SAM-binding protein YcdF (DUF218 family)|nr:YdcF family protein [Gudongella sp.]
MKKTIRIITTLVAIVFIYLAMAHVMIVSSINQDCPSEADYLIVLGARLYGDIPSPSLQMRLDSAIEYIRENQYLKLVLSGGQGPGESITEAEGMKNYLVNRGIPAEKLILEKESKNTFENLRNSIELIRDEEPSKDLSIMIVTSDYHLFRSKLIAKRLGIYSCGIPAETPASVKIISWLREYLAIGKTLLLDW